MVGFGTLAYLLSFVLRHYVITETVTKSITQSFHDGGSYPIETSPLICRVNEGVMRFI